MEPASLVVGTFAVGTGLALLTRDRDHDAPSVERRWTLPRSRFVDVRGLPVHVVDEGPPDDPVPLVLLHPTASSLHAWESWCAHLRTHRRVVRFDLPGFGLTGPFRGQWAPHDYRGDRFAEVGLALLEALGIGRAVLVGSSLGGETAWRMAVRAPSRVERLVLMAATGPRYVPLREPLAFRMSALPLLNRASEWTLPRHLVRKSLETVFAHPSRVTDALVDRTRALALRPGNRAALRLRLAQRQLDTDDVARCAQLSMPVLLLWGRQDRLVQLEVAHRFQSLLPNASLVVLEDVGHLPHEEQPDAALNAVRAFLDGAP